MNPTSTRREEESDFRKLDFAVYTTEKPKELFWDATTKPVANKLSRARGSQQVLTGSHEFPRASLPGGFPP